jgi:glycosyltransferase involved in cell wall biosynthesis
MEIWGNTLVKNEERCLWFAVTSAIDYVDRLLLWDTGSSDSTPEIISALRNKYPNKIITKEFGEVDINEFTQARQAMLEETKGDWVLVLDGDEVWWEGSIKELTNTISKDNCNLESFVHKYFNLVGDIYHFQEESAGHYQIDAQKGHLNLRAIKRGIPGLHLEKPHGQIGFYDSKGKLVQDRNKSKRKYLGLGYLHFTHLARSIAKEADKEVPKRKMKYKYELGVPFNKDFYYPEVFFKARPEIVSSVWERRSNLYVFKAFFQTPLKKIKRRIIKSGTGY